MSAYDRSRRRNLICQQRDVLVLVCHDSKTVNGLDSLSERVGDQDVHGCVVAFDQDAFDNDTVTIVATMCMTHGGTSFPCPVPCHPP